MSDHNSLDDLLIDEEDLNEQVLTETIAPYAGVGNQSGAFIPTDEFEQLNANQQTAVVLMHRKATYELGFTDEETVTPRTISDISGINHNTVKTAVRSLDNMNLVENNDGVYRIPTYNYERARLFIEEG